jgi:hypothetical protein
MRARLLVLLAGCSFHSSAGTTVDGNPPPADAIDASPPTSWWDPAWPHRRVLDVTTGDVRPDKGYQGYTARLASLDVAMVADLDASCDGLRVAWYDGTAWTELPRHVIGCGTAKLDLRFSLPADIADSSTWSQAYLYYGNPAPSPAASALGTSVYLWWDDASTDHAADYVHGRMDPWLAAGWDDSLAWNADGSYHYDTGDDSQSSYRRAVDERDVLVEAEWFHTSCYPNNMQTAVCARGIISGGVLSQENADAYYCTTRAQNPLCNDVDEAIYDGDIVKTDNEIIAIHGMTDPPPIVTSQWRTQALAVFGANPTQLRFWDADASWPALAAPPADRLLATGMDLADYTNRGFAGIMVAQDVARVRNIVIRRYVEPEPGVAVGPEETLSH